MRADIGYAAVDVLIVIAAYTFGLALRMLDPGVDVGRTFWADLAWAMPVIILVHIVANILAGAYGHVWEFASANEAVRVVLACVVSGAVLATLAGVARESTGRVVPFAVIVVGAGLTLAGMGLVRFRSRMFSFSGSHSGTRMLIVGTGREAAAFARQAPTLNGGCLVVGFLSDSPVVESKARRLAGLPILGTLQDIPSVIRAHNIDEVVVVGADAPRTRQVVDLCLDVDARLRILPAAEDVMLDRLSALDVREIRVEDLLVRPQVATDLSEVAELLRDRRVLITGAGGSIGSEIVAQVLGFSPAQVFALDRDETLLHDARLKWGGDVKTVLCDLREPVKVLRTFEEIQPEIIFHAAALKHVPVLEAYPEEAVLTNIIGTRNVIEAGSRVGMSRFVLNSTDKAVDPSSVMGATKRIAELMVQLGADRNDGCVYSAVRFGNVLGSRGSVIPTFVDQIKSGGPVTVTDADMTRYFMTTSEAVERVLQASALSEGSEVFILDMGEPVRIVELARRLIRLAGLSPESDISIVYTGIRPGEKLNERLSISPMHPTRNPQISEAKLDYPNPAVLMETVSDLEQEARAVDRYRVRELLSNLIAHDV
ncbi:MAG TPA: nucleoside-diphosphate sugar epimerase/dehydratase, partial [Acidimicrobiia bacterium]|nr:nucleoside-diphosphate sugar epimerase/dehydratase [Acidimicrobiia bacterium]